MLIIQVPSIKYADLHIIAANLLTLIENSSNLYSA